MKVDWNKIESISYDLDAEKAGKALFEMVIACKRTGLEPESCLRVFVGKQVGALINGIEQNT